MNPDTYVATPASKQNIKSLKKQLKMAKKRQEAEQKADADRVARIAEKNRLKKVSIDALEKAAGKGDIAAATELYRLASLM